jgi:formylglycine-generating enzyme required for sulfatase activity
VNNLFWLAWLNGKGRRAMKVGARAWVGGVLLAGLLAAARVFAQDLAPKLSVALGDGVKMEFVLIKAGCFMMGSEKGEADEKPLHDVTITKPFYMGVYEVTQAQWMAIMGDNPSYLKGNDLPVESVTWDDAQKFAAKLKTKLAQSLRCRLPTEAEWEYACRAGTTTPFSFGSALNGSGANCDGNFPFGGAEKGPSLQRTTRVSSYEPNAFGLYDMHGNVWEWCADWHDRTYYAQSPVDDPTGSTRVWNRATRGGSWSYSAIRCRSAYRNGYSPLYQRPNSGFRVVCDVTAQPRKR